MSSAEQSSVDGIAPQGRRSAAAGSSRATPRFSAKKFLLALVALIGGGMLLIAGANYVLDPLHFSASGHRQVAAVLLSGKNYSVFDANMDFRALRRETIAQMTTTPDVIAFSGSRFELARKDLFPGKTYHDAFVHNDFFEDLLAFSGMLYEHKRLPKNLVFSVRWKSFQPIDPVLRDADEFKQFWSEYRTMADRLGLEKEAWYDVFPFAYWSHLLSVDNIVRHVKYRLAGKRQGPVDAGKMEDMDVIHADGSMDFSAEHTASFRDILLSRGVANQFTDAETVEEDAARRGAAMAKLASWPVDPKRLDGFGVLLEFLKTQGTNVTIAIVPFHEAYWKGIVGSPFHKSIVSMEERVRSIAAAHGANVVGSQDPGRVGCRASDMRDYVHPNYECLKHVFKDIPIKD